MMLPSWASSLSPPPSLDLQAWLTVVRGLPANGSDAVQRSRCKSVAIPHFVFQYVHQPGGSASVASAKGCRSRFLVHSQFPSVVLTACLLRCKTPKAMLFIQAAALVASTYGFLFSRH